MKTELLNLKGHTVKALSKRVEALKQRTAKQAGAAMYFVCVDKESGTVLVNGTDRFTIAEWQEIQQAGNFLDFSQIINGGDK